MEETNIKHVLLHYHLTFFNSLFHTVDSKVALMLSDIWVNQSSSCFSMDRSFWELRALQPSGYHGIWGAMTLSVLCPSGYCGTQDTIVSYSEALNSTKSCWWPGQDGAWWALPTVWGFSFLNRNGSTSWAPEGLLYLLPLFSFALPLFQIRVTIRKDYYSAKV